METYPVEVEAHPTCQDGALLEDHLYAYNVEQTAYDDGTYGSDRGKERPFSAAFVGTILTCEPHG